MGNRYTWLDVDYDKIFEAVNDVGYSLEEASCVLGHSPCFLYTAKKQNSRMKLQDVELISKATEKPVDYFLKSGTLIIEPAKEAIGNEVLAEIRDELKKIAEALAGMEQSRRG